MSKLLTALDSKDISILEGGSYCTVFSYKDIVVKKYAGRFIGALNKLENEIDYLKNTPAQLQNIFPDILEYIVTDDLVAFSMPYYKDMKPIADYCVGREDIRKVWNCLDNVLSLCEKSLYNINIQDVSDDYLEKTQFLRVKSSLEALSDPKLGYRDILVKPKKLILNGEELKNAEEIIEILSKSPKIAELLTPKFMSLFHGDLHTGNIISNLKNNVLIDPRGQQLGSRDYDISKNICHFLVRYDLIRADLFEVENVDNEFRVSITDEVINNRFESLNKLGNSISNLLII